MKDKKTIRDYTPESEEMDWYYYVETEKASYHSRNLTRVLNLWKDSGDNSEVINVACNLGNECNLNEL